MELTYILVDFENVQPQDLHLLQGQQYRVKVFHGAHQNKLDMTMVKALQPLGEHVEYLQSEKPGKNALDFHVAFCMGRLLQTHMSNGVPARFGVVSRDGGFDSLLRHMRSLGYAAKKAETVRDALNFASDERARSTQARVEPSLAADKPLADPLPMASASAPMQAKTATTARPAQKLATTIKDATKEGGMQPKPASPTAKAVAEDVDKVIEHLRAHSKNRPTKRIALERHIPSLLGGQKRSPATIQAVVVELVRRGAVEFRDKAVKYTISAARKLTPPAKPSTN